MAYKHGDRRVKLSRKYLGRVEVLDDLVESCGFELPARPSGPYKGYADGWAEIGPYIAGLALVQPKSSTASPFGVVQFNLEERSFGLDCLARTQRVRSATTNDAIAVE